MKHLKKGILLALSITVVLLSQHTGVFGDNVLFISKIGNALLSNGFSWLHIPLEIDPGHPPFTATIMALSWSFFGKSLIVSHWLMLPFIFGTLWQICNFIKYFLEKQSLQAWAFLLLLADPTLLATLFQITPELPLLFFFLLALNATLRNKTALKIGALALLGIVSYRGMMLCAGIFLIEVLLFTIVQEKPIKKVFSKKRIGLYFLAATPAILYLSWRIILKGWIISHPLEIWGSAWEFSSFKEFTSNLIRNTLVLGFRFADFGRFSLILFTTALLLKKRQLFNNKKVKKLLIIFFFSTIVIYSMSLLIKNPMGHRYFTPSYLALGLLCFVLIQNIKLKKVSYSILLSCLICGNLIVYPAHIAQGWDASLAHLPYWELRKSAISYMDKNKIPITETASFFPNQTSIDNIELNGDSRSFSNFTGKESYVLYSNVYNLNDADLSLLETDYKTIKSFQKRRVKVNVLIKKGP